MSERNGKNKIHNIINKAMKGVVVFALFLFIIFVLKNKAEFSEKSLRVDQIRKFLRSQ